MKSGKRAVSSFPRSEEDLENQYFTFKKLSDKHQTIEIATKETPIAKRTSQIKGIINSKEMELSSLSTVEGSKRLFPSTSLDKMAPPSHDSKWLALSEPPEEENQNESSSSSQNTTVSEEKVRCYFNDQLINEKMWEVFLFGQIEEDLEENQEGGKIPWNYDPEENENDPVGYLKPIDINSDVSDEENSSMDSNYSEAQPDMSDLDDLISLQCASEPCRITEDYE